MRVVIVGAGIGGLTLAQGLHRAGMEVSVHERDPRVEATGGYRLHLEERACAALRRHLSPQHYQALLASSAPRGSLRRTAWTDHYLRPIATSPSDPGAEVLMIGRVPLRRLLAHGLGDQARFGVSYVDHTVGDDGRVAVRFDDGSREVADVLVGADGARSRVAEVAAGRRMSTPVGYGGIAGRTPLTPRTRELLPAVLDQGPVLALGPDGSALFLAGHDPATEPALDPSWCTDVPAITEAPALIWGLNSSHTIIDPDRAACLDGPGLVELAGSRLGRWSRDLRTLVAAADPATVAYFGFHQGDPDADLTPWPAGPVTALGDAVHAMPPTAGRAAATAIRDADHLTEQLVAARDGHTTLPLAVHGFHRDMAVYAPDAIRASLRPLSWVRRLHQPALRGLAGLALTAAAGTHRLRTGPTADAA